MIDKKIMTFPKMKKMLGLLAGLAILQAIFIIGQGFGLSKAVTLLWEGKALPKTYFWIGLFFLAYLSRHGLTYFKESFLTKYAKEISTTLRKDLLEKIFQLGPILVGKKGSGHLITASLDGIQQVENYIQLILTKMMDMVVIPLLLLIAIFYLDITSGITLLIVFPLIILFMIILGYAAQSKADSQYKTFQFLANHFLDSLRGLDTLKVFGQSETYGKSIYNTSERFRKATMSTLKVAMLSTFALDFFTTLSVAVVAVFLGLRLIKGEILLFPALTVLILAPEYFLPIRNFAGDYHATLDGKNALAEIFSILAEKGLPKQHHQISSFTKETTLKLTDITLNYEDQKALNPISFEITGFQKIGVIGMSGAGKSSLMNLLAGFLTPTSGNFQLNHQVLPHLVEEKWQEQVIYIPQHPYIFQKSLWDNLTFYAPEASEKEVREAIEVVGLKDFLASLPEGLETFIGESGRNLSGGQQQRIALARGLLDQKRHILIFDEPTAHLDIETEMELKEKMLPLMENKLVFFSTHRLHWMKEMDQILVLEKGQLQEQGTSQELLAKKGAFYHLVKELQGGNLDV